MSQKNEPTPQSRLPDALARYASDPRHLRLTLRSTGQLEVVEAIAKRNISQFFFGVPSLDHDKTLEVLVAVKRYLHDGNFGLDSDEEVLRLARDVLHDFEREKPLIHTVRRRLGDAFQQAIVHFVRENRLKRALLIEQDLIAQWERPWRDHSITKDLPRLALVLTGSRAQKPLRHAVTGRSGEAIASLLEGLGENLGEAIDASALAELEGEALEAALHGLIDEQLNGLSPLLRLLKALDFSSLRTMEKHLKDVLREATGDSMSAENVHRHFGLAHVRLESGYIVVTHHIRWVVRGDPNDPRKGYTCDCDATLTFDRQMRMCRRAEISVYAPEFGQDEPEAYCALVNDSLQSQFPFVYA